MSGFEIEAALLRLPPELLRMILPNPAELHGIRVDDDDGKAQGWLALKTDWEEVVHNLFFGYYKTVGPQHTLQTLRALSQTCKSLRAYTLPMLWSVVHIKTLRELGELRDVLREAPYIAPLIRHFTFLWNMNGDFEKCSPYPNEHGTVLDMAFVDRGALWEETRQSVALRSEAVGSDLGRRINYRVLAVGGERSPYFWWEESYYEPGHESRAPDAKVCEQDCRLMTPREQLRVVASRGQTAHLPNDPHDAYRGPNLDRSGPDGQGEDPRIKNADDYNACVSEVVGRLSALKVFSWRSPVSPVPASIMDGLKKANKLSMLSLLLQESRNSASMVPFWELGPRLDSLSLRTRPEFLLEPGDPRDKRQELAEAEDEVILEELESFELPSTPPADRDEAASVHLAILYRTIIAAAQGGRLKRVSLPEGLIQQPFAIRQLLPCWVGVERWADVALAIPRPEEAAAAPSKRWSVAASTLRVALAHSSVWLPESSAGARNDRLLTREDVQAMHASMLEQGLPNFAGVAPKRDWFSNIMVEAGMAPELIRLDKNTSEGSSDAVPAAPASRPLVELYLPWLASDGDLAQAVADAWNKVVERGESDKVKCRCELCVARQM